MAIPNVSLDDTFDQWRQKTNTGFTSIGDLLLLNTTNKTDLVSAVNEVSTKGNEFSVAMSIALG